MVVPFLFFSGYGIYEQIKGRGDNYVKSLPKNRVLKIYLMFLLAWLAFFIVSFIFQSNYSVKHYISSVFGITSIGNSNWYVVIVLAMYLSTYLSFRLVPDRKMALVINILMGLLVFFILTNKPDLDSCWWNTIIAYYAGLLYSYHKEKIVALYKKHNWTRILFLLLSIVITVIGGVLNIFYPSDFYFAIMVVGFSLIFPSLLALFKISNKFLLILGKYTFWIYILQRLPMLIFSHIPVIKNIVYLYFAICMIITAILAFSFDKLFSLIWKKDCEKIGNTYIIYNKVILWRILDRH